MRIQFDIEFNLGLVLAAVLTGVLLTGIIIASKDAQPQRPMRGPENVDLSSSDDE